MIRFIFFTLFVFFFAKMYKSNQNKSNFLYKLCFIVLIAISIASCSRDHKAEISAIEQLETKLNSNLETLEIDETLISTRAQYIEKVLRYFSNDYNKEIRLELGNDLEKLKILRKLYVKRVLEHANNLKEQEELGIQLATLKSDLENGAMSKEEFKSYFNTEKTDTEVLLNSSLSVKKSLYEVEPEYTRLMKTLEPLLPSTLQ